MNEQPFVQVETKRDTNLLTGQEIVRVKYRPEGARKWTRLLVVPDGDQTVDELLTQGHEIAAAHMAALTARELHSRESQRSES